MFGTTIAGIYKQITRSHISKLYRETEIFDMSRNQSYKNLDEILIKNFISNLEN